MTAAGKWEELEAVAGRWTAWDPQSGDAWLHLAQAAEKQGDLRRVAECLDKVPDSDPRRLAALAQRVELLFRRLNQPQEAAATCARMLAIDPLSAVARQRLIFLHAMTLRRRDMVREIRKAIEIRREPPEAYVYLAGADWIHFSNGYALNSRWLESDPGNETYEVARAYHLATMGEDAKNPLDPTGGPTGETMMRRCLDRFPRNPEVLAYFIEKAIAAGDADEAAELLSRVPDGAADDNRFWRHKGWYHLAIGQPDQAESAYREALKLNPYDWKSRHQLAGVLRRLGREAEADETARLAAEGKILMRRLEQLPNADGASGELLAELATHAQLCGDDLVVSGLYFRLTGKARPARGGRIDMGRFEVDNADPIRSTQR